MAHGATALGRGRCDGFTLKIRVSFARNGARRWGLARGAVVSEREIAHARDHARKGWSLTLNSLELVSSDVDATLLSRFWLRRPPPIGGFLEKVERTVRGEKQMKPNSLSYGGALTFFSTFAFRLQCARMTFSTYDEGIRK